MLQLRVLADRLSNLVQKFGGEIGAVGPFNGLSIGIDGHLPKEIDFLQWFKYFTVDFVWQIHLFHGAIVEVQFEAIPPL